MYVHNPLHPFLKLSWVVGAIISSSVHIHKGIKHTFLFSTILGFPWIKIATTSQTANLNNINFNEAIWNLLAK